MNLKLIPELALFYIFILCFIFCWPWIKRTSRNYCDKIWAPFLLRKFWFLWHILVALWQISKRKKDWRIFLDSDLFKDKFCFTASLWNICVQGWSFCTLLPPTTLNSSRSSAFRNAVWENCNFSSIISIQPFE